MSATKQKKDRDAVREEAQERAERIRREAMRAAEPPGTRAAYADRFRSALREQAEALGGGLDSARLMLSRSRAAMATWSGSGLHPLDAEAVRCDVHAEEADRLGVPLLRALPVPTRSTTTRTISGSRVPAPVPTGSGAVARGAERAPHHTRTNEGDEA